MSSSVCPRVSPIPGTEIGALVTDFISLSPKECRELLHKHGMLLFKGLHGYTAQGLVDFMQERFADVVMPKGAKNLVEGAPVQALGNLKDPATGKNLTDGTTAFVPASTNGARLVQPSNEELQKSLVDWMEKNQACTFMEWHTDGMFVPVPPHYNALFCREPGTSETAFSNSVRGYEQLPEDLRKQAENAFCFYRPSIMYGGKLKAHAVQQKAFGERNDRLNSTLTSEETEYRRPMVEAHPQTGEKAVRLQLKALHTVDSMEPEEGQMFAWQVMRAATANGNVYFHKWEEGDLILWDHRRMVHARVPYDAEKNQRLMLRFEFEKFGGPDSGFKAPSQPAKL